MRKITIIIFLIMLMFFLSNCKSTDSLRNNYIKTFNFKTSSEGWIWGFADYPAGSESSYELTGSFSKLPAPLNPTEGSIKISGNNHSDDLFMFIKKKLSGLNPNKQYKASILINLASNAAEDSFGIGGSPGSSVYLKVGIVKDEPIAIAEGTYYRMNLDKGNQAVGGEHMETIGNISNGLSVFEYALIQRQSGNILFESNSNGEFWLIIGTDSGFEGKTTIYYDSIEIEIQENE